MSTLSCSSVECSFVNIYNSRNYFFADWLTDLCPMNRLPKNIIIKQNTVSCKIKGSTTHGPEEIKEVKMLMRSSVCCKTREIGGKKRGKIDIGYTGDV